MSIRNYWIQKHQRLQSVKWEFLIITFIFSTEKEESELFKFNFYVILADVYFGFVVGILMDLM